MTTSIDEAIDAVGFGRFQVRLVIISGLLFMADAMEIMLLSFLQILIRDEWNLTAEDEASITAVVFLGELPGALFWGYLGDRIGRRKAFLFSTTFVAVYGILSAFATNFTMLLVFRALVGFGVSGGLIPFDAIAEFTPTAQRNKVLMMVQYSWTIGSVFVAVLAWIVVEPFGWRCLAILCSLPLIVALFLSKELPESPKWLAAHGQMDQAIKIVNQMALINGKTEFPVVNFEKPTEHPQPLRIRLKAMGPSFWVKIRAFSVIWLGFGACYFGVVLLCPRVFQTASSGKFNYQAIVFSVLSEACGTTISILLIGKLDQRYIQAVAYFTCGVALFFLGMEWSLGWNIFFASLSRASINAGSSTTWAATAEAFPTYIRTSTHGFLNAIGRIGGLMTPYIADSDSLDLFTICCIYSLMLFTVSTASCSLPPQAMSHAA